MSSNDVMTIATFRRAWAVTWSYVSRAARLSKSRRPDQWLNVVVLLAAAGCIATAGPVLARRAWPGAAEKTATDPAPAFDFDRADYTLAFVLHSACGHCSESMPALRAIAGAAATIDRSVRTIAVGVESRPVLNAYLRSSSLPVETVYSVPVTRLSNVSPRVVLFDRHGVVLGDWIGQVDAEQARDILAALSRQPRRPFGVPLGNRR